MMESQVTIKDILEKFENWHMLIFENVTYDKDDVEAIEQIADAKVHRINVRVIYGNKFILDITGE